MNLEGRRSPCASFFVLRTSSFILVIVLLVACVTAPATPAVTAAPLVPTPIPGALYVNAANSIGPISPDVFGANYGPWIVLMPAVKPLEVA
jgi:hypothetical protein